ncbi:hypothetical protein [Flavobacterium sp. ACAM 123]|jgi:hypothetical protein|uniref:hypothetical protein n=1 Tax=Flavobacterium sp. ACAM 123 TaxID=1189620 RepID=UPI0002F11B45|nr:hypothetical protein [Flavobacterium sp. ACAM 123]
MKDLIQKINAKFETFKTESQSLVDKGVKAAGPRARKATLENETIHLTREIDDINQDTVGFS